jgi:hypothetical protein
MPFLLSFNLIYTNRLGSAVQDWSFGSLALSGPAYFHTADSKNLPNIGKVNADTVDMFVDMICGSKTAIGDVKPPLVERLLWRVVGKRFLIPIMIKANDVTAEKRETGGLSLISSFVLALQSNSSRSPLASLHSCMVSQQSRINLIPFNTSYISYISYLNITGLETIGEVLSAVDRILVSRMTPAQRRMHGIDGDNSDSSSTCTDPTHNHDQDHTHNRAHNHIEATETNAEINTTATVVAVAEAAAEAEAALAAANAAMTAANAAVANADTDATEAKQAIAAALAAAETAKTAVAAVTYADTDATESNQTTSAAEVARTAAAAAAAAAATLKLGAFNPLILADPTAFPFLVGPPETHNGNSKTNSNGDHLVDGSSFGEEDVRNDATRIYAPIKERPTVADITFAAMCMPLLLPAYGSSFIGVDSRWVGA